MNKGKAVVVLSGGQDSTTCLYWALNQTLTIKEVMAITFDYGQRHQREINAAVDIAAKTAKAYSHFTAHEVVELGPILKGRSPLTNPVEKLETYPDYKTMDQVIGSRVELTFVPMRNDLFLTVAANRAMVCEASVIVTGVCQQDNANYPDCRASFIAAKQTAINEALGGDYINLVAPLIYMSKAEGIRIARHLPGCWEALAYSHTAYDGQYPPTGKDHASILRAQGFLEAGEPDPLVVRAWKEGLMPLPDTVNYKGVS